MLSTDENIFIEGSEVRQRMRDYGKLVEELHIIVKNQKSKTKNQNFGNVFIYPANGYIKIFRTGAKLISQFPRVSISRLVITSQDPFELGLIAYLLKKKFNLPLQLQVHTDFLSLYFQQESVRNKIKVVLGKWLVKKADGLRVVSERIKDSLCFELQVLSSKITVLPIVYDMERFKTGAVKIDLRRKYPDRFIILMATRLAREKNIGLAIRAMAEVVKVCPQALLLIVGSGPEHTNIKSQILGLKLQEDVVMENWSDDIISYYRTADLFLLTSNYEGGARSPAEAMASGLPVVMTDVAPAGETIINGKNGFVVLVGDYRQLADKLIELASDAGKLAIFKKQSLAMAVGFITKEVYLKLYYQALTNALTQKNYE
ncbi:MAG: glycosyltransferase family 4 protein [Minisyncoccia bacterium]